MMSVSCIIVHNFWTTHYVTSVKEIERRFYILMSSVIFILYQLFVRRNVRFFRKWMKFDLSTFKVL